MAAVIALSALVRQVVVIAGTVAADRWRALVYRERSHASTWREPSHADTFHEQSHTDTYRGP